MEKKRFGRINSIIAAVIFAISSLVYLATIEPTASFWDCGEFIASSYKLEVGHPPGNPTFNLFARFFTMFTDAEGAAAAVNSLSALCSSLTILFLYLTIVHFGRRLLEKRGRALTTGAAISIFAAGAVGAMAYCFSDTFWFSAVEGEVYAMSSLFTAVVFWAILKWEEHSDEKYAARWIVLISLLTGLSVGVHLLNLLTIPAIVFIVYYRTHSGDMSFWKGFVVLVLSSLLLALILFGIIPYLPQMLAFVDRIFVNGFGAPFNLGAAFFILVLLAGCFLGLNALRRKEKALAHTALLCFTTFVIGYSLFAITIIRSCANTPTNEYQPDNPYTLIRYLAREQYGSNPLIYGQAYTSPYDVKTIKYYTPLDGRYHETENVVPVYPAGSKMLFPRMWNGFDEHHKAFYDTYVTGKHLKKVTVGGETIVIQMPSFADNLRFFFDYQINYMYIRYFMWNFVGRQNDFHGQVPGELICGNWESGIPFIDRVRLGDQSSAPDILAHNKGKNHYFFLPLLLGLVGLFFQAKHDGRNSWVTILLFVLTGLAIVVYINQTPYQVRERDYSYAGSFYVFAIWIGLGVMAVQEWLERLLKDSRGIRSASAAAVLCSVVPVLMGCENWDDHDRSGRYTARDMAFNHLMTTENNSMLVTHGDNDTFPLWYAQEVEGIRTDVRIVNTSLLGTDWYIDQMQRRQYESDPLEIDIPRIQYLYGTNDFPYVTGIIDHPILARDAIEIFKNPRFKLSDGKTDFIPAKKLMIPVNKENVRKYHIVPEKDMDRVVDSVMLEIRPDRIGKTDLIILDVLSNYDWDRPLYYVTPTCDVALGLENWSQYNGFCYKFIPIRKQGDEQIVDENKMYDLLMSTYRLASLDAEGVYYDYQNIYTFCAVIPLRDMFYNTARKFYENGDTARAVELLDRCIECMPAESFPYNISWLRSLNELSVLRIMELYLKCDRKEEAEKVARRFAEETTKTLRYLTSPYGDDVISGKLAEDNFTLFSYMLDILETTGSKDLADALRADLLVAIDNLAE